MYSRPGAVRSGVTLEMITKMMSLLNQTIMQAVALLSRQVGKKCDEENEVKRL